MRSGSRVAAVAASGACLASGFFHLQTDEQKEATRGLVVGLAREHGAEAVAIANGSAGREAEVFVRAALKDAGLDIPVVLVGEGGSGAWGSSETVREELPDLDPPVRAAVFAARRLQDPLRELTRIEPRSIFGRHHVHDISPAVLIRTLNATVDSCVHEVGVDLNSAPRPLLARVSGHRPGPRAGRSRSTGRRTARSARVGSSSRCRSWARRPSPTRRAS